MAIDISASDIDQLQTDDRLELLNDIDRFRQHGLDELPQIVVCGDTSSGKSSVLEALSGIPFPVDSSICTRFATALALRYTTSDGVTGDATITPAPKSSESHRGRVEGFKQPIVSLESIPSIMRDAQEVMGVGGDTGISRDVLHLNLYGRHLPNLTLVDLPGIIHASSNAKDITSVQELVEHYFKQRHSIILIVVSAENPIDNQAILTLSRNFDPTGMRSIGVITKPDLLSRPDKVGLRPKIIELAENKHTAFKFKRPWHIVRCLNDAERSEGLDRETLENELLSTSPWDQFPRSQRGIRSLRSKLSEYLQEHISHVLPELADTLEQKAVAVKSSLEKLGPTRVTSMDRMQHLIRLSRRYGQLVNAALMGDYSETFFKGENSPTRLRAVTMALSDGFEDGMRQFGHDFEIVDSTQAMQGWASKKPRQLLYSQALAQVDRLIQSHRGPELPGLLNPRLVRELFKEQSKKWPNLVQAFTSRVLEATSTFLRRVVYSVSPSDGRTAELLLRHVFDDALEELKAKLTVKVSELLEPFQGFFLYTSRRRLEAKLGESLEQIEAPRDSSIPVAGSQHQVAPVIALSSDESNASKLLRWSMAYYDVALQIFMNNVVVLGVEGCLLSRLEEMFSPETIARMNDETLQLIGGESPETIAEREDLEAQLQNLERSLRTCRRHISRFGLHSDSPTTADEEIVEPAAPEIQSKSTPIKSATRTSSADVEDMTTRTSHLKLQSEASTVRLQPQPQPQTQPRVSRRSRVSLNSRHEDRSSSSLASPTPRTGSTSSFVEHSRSPSMTEIIPSAQPSTGSSPLGRFGGVPDQNTVSSYSRSGLFGPTGSKGAHRNSQAQDSEDSDSDL